MYASSTEQQRRNEVQTLAEQLYRERYHYLLRIATRNSANYADAEEAVQQAFLAFLAKFDPDSEAPPLAWGTLTLKRECWAKRARAHLDFRVGQAAAPGSDPPAFSPELIPSRSAGPEEMIERAEHLVEAREQLAGLKPAERRALSLIAAGFSYREVSDITDWSHTKVNRSIAEGRERLQQLRTP